MDRESALIELPPAMATALRLEEAQFGHDVIAIALGIEPTGVSGLLQVAHTKFDRLLAEPVLPRPR